MARQQQGLINVSGLFKYTASTALNRPSLVIATVCWYVHLIIKVMKEAILVS